jgi:hypothetical protein
LGARDADFSERGFRKCSFSRRGTFAYSGRCGPVIPLDVGR